MKRFIAATACALTIASFVTSSVSYAVNETGQALEIAPPVVNLTADPGEVKKTNINLRDVADSALVVTGKINDFTANGEDGTPKLTLDDGEESPYSIKTWIDPLKELTLKSREIATLPVTIRVPADAAPGGYYGVIRFTAVAPGISGNGVALSASLGALIFIRVNGDAKESMNVEEFYTADNRGTKNWLFESQPITFVTRTNNTGNVYEQPVGQITVKDMFGNAVASVNMNLEQRNVLPGSIRKFDSVMDKSNVGNRFLLGYYTAEITVHYGANDATTTSKLGFWVIPWRLALMVIGGIALLVIVIRTLIKRYTDRVVGRSRSSRRR